MAFSTAGGGPFSTGPKMNVTPLIVVQIHHAKPSGEHPQVMVNEETVDWDHLRERLRDIFAIRVERIAYVEADDDIDFQDVADVIAVARMAGVDRVGLLTEDGKHLPMAG